MLLFHCYFFLFLFLFLLLMKAEKRVLITTKNSVIEKYNALRKNAAQLESFRKVWLYK